MPDGFLTRTSAEVALDVVRSYLEFADEREKARYKKIDEYLALYEKAYDLIISKEESRGPKSRPGF